MELLPVSVVERWHAALNAHDYDALCALTADDVEVMGVGRGPTALREWLHFTAEPLRWFCGPPGLVVVEQRGSWRFPPTTIERMVASAFRVFNGRVVRYRRYDDLEEALAAVCLTDEDEVLVSAPPIFLTERQQRPPHRTGDRVSGTTW